MIERSPVVRANSIRMKLSQHEGVFLLVEGRDDRLFMSRFVHDSSCKIEVLESKQNVTDVVSILQEARVDGVIGLVDADLDRVIAPAHQTLGLLMHDHHDLETMLFCSDALGLVLGEYGSRQKLGNFSGDMLESLISRALPAGYLRMYSAVNRLGLRFQGLEYERWIDRNSFQADIDLLVRHVKNRSNRQDIPDEILKQGISDMQSRTVHPLEVVNGDDLIGVLMIALRRVWGNQSANSLSASDLRRSFRLAYTDHDFVRSGLYRSIRNWEERNLGTRVLRVR